ncbi:MAG: rod shape-determining protein RodA [Clostridia bacterium]|nr:rod shape-determining protein RodA [Clostridia bacterium]MBP3597802.1 rod shape-determining protein RodA [Clostridia bacterium]
MRNKKFKNTEWAIVIVSIMLFCIGLIALFSATQSTEYGEFKKQLQWFAFSIPVLIVVSIIDYNIIIRFSPLLFTILLVSLVGVLFTEPINGASSWFKIGDFLAIQPSELGKIVAILFWALVLNKLQLKGKREINKIWKLFLFMIAYLIPAFFIIKQPDYGTAAAYTVAFLFMLFVSGLDKKYIITALILVIILVPVSYMYILPEHAKTRIDVFLNPELDPRGAGYNIMQSKLAIGSGQLVGMGLFKGNQTQLGFLSPKTTDFIFSVIGEEMGFIATGAIVILYIILVTKTIYIAKTAKDNLGSYIAIGIAGIFFFHMVENIGMTIGLLPITGVPLPFVSYGGSSLITNFMCIGLLLNISSRRQKSIFVDGMM